MLRLLVSDLAYLSAGLAIAVKTLLPSSDNALKSLVLLICTLVLVNVLLGFFELCIDLVRLGRHLRWRAAMGWLGVPQTTHIRRIMIEPWEELKHDLDSGMNAEGIEAIVNLVHVTMLAIHWWWTTIAWMLNALCRMIVSQLRPEGSSTSTESRQMRELAKTMRQIVAERSCKVCYDAEANSIVLNCCHIDLCIDCLSSLAARAQRKCPEIETWCQLAGSVHVHCLVCRGGGERRKVFFA